MENVILGRMQKKTAKLPVGVEVVRSLYGTVLNEKATAGIIVTTSHFSRPAKDFHAKIKYQMNLVDFNHLARMIKEIK